MSDEPYIPYEPETPSFEPRRPYEPYEPALEPHVPFVPHDHSHHRSVGPLALRQWLPTSFEWIGEIISGGERCPRLGCDWGVVDWMGRRMQGEKLEAVRVRVRVRALTPQQSLPHDPLFSHRGWQRRVRGAAGWCFWDVNAHVCVLLSRALLVLRAYIEVIYC